MTPEPPQPGTAAEMFLAAILDELRAIRARIPETSTAPDAPGAVELTEPDQPAKRPPARKQPTRRKP